jgi:hypothetical protein
LKNISDGSYKIKTNQTKLILILKAQYADPKKKWVAFDFKFKKFNIIQPISIIDIFSSLVKNCSFFCCFSRFLIVFAHFSTFKRRNIKKASGDICAHFLCFTTNFSEIFSISFF